MDDTQPGRAARARRVARRGLRLALGPAVVSGVLFAGVFASAGSDDPDISGAQPIDYHEECTKEGCAREEVKELWRRFDSECIDEGCWQEEVAELAGSGITPIERNGIGWYAYTRPSAVEKMLYDFSYRLDHYDQVQSVTVKNGPTDTFGHKLLRLLGTIGDVPVWECDLDPYGNPTNCGPPNPF
jgi:hypothetical protein